jgi:Icc protein
VPEQQGKPLRIAQITDTHLYASPDGELLGLNTRHCLEQVIELVTRSRQPDLIVASGDLTHDGSEQAYLQVRECFSHINAPIYCLPGNHDEADALRSCMNSDCFHSIRSQCIAGWQMLFLDSTIPGDEGGHLKGNELKELDELLAACPDLPALIWLHHQPVLMGSRWLDTMAVDNPEAFFNIIDRHSQVRAVVWGHVHQAFEQQRNDVRLLATPSTCLQFLPKSDDFAVDPVPPGYRWLDLYPDGTLKTGIERLQQIPGEIDLSARGY